MTRLSPPPCYKIVLGSGTLCVLAVVILLAILGSGTDLGSSLAAVVTKTVSNATDADSMGSPAPTGTTGPTLVPTFRPTRDPTERPTEEPTRAPTKQPTKQPTAPTLAPTRFPTLPGETWSPTLAPTDSPTMLPTEAPTPRPTSEAPTPYPTYAPTSLRPTFAPTPPTTAAPTQQPTMDSSQKVTVSSNYELQLLGSNDVYFSAIDYVDNRTFIDLPMTFGEDEHTPWSDPVATTLLSGVSVDSRLDADNRATADAQSCFRKTLTDACVFTEDNMEVRYIFKAHPLKDIYVPPTVPELRPPMATSGASFSGFSTSRNNLNKREGAVPSVWEAPEAEPDNFYMINRYNHLKPYFPDDTKAARQVNVNRGGVKQGLIPVQLVTPQYTDYINAASKIINVIKNYWEFLSRGVIRYVGTDGSGRPTNSNVNLPLSRAGFRKGLPYYVNYLWWRSGWAMPTEDSGVYYQRWMNSDVSYSKPSWGGNYTAYINTDAKAPMLYWSGALLGLADPVQPNYTDTYDEAAGWRSDCEDMSMMNTAVSSWSMSAPQYHALGFAQTDEVVYLRPAKTYRLREVRAPELLTQVALVFLEPFTGNRIWISYVYKESARFMAVHQTTGGMVEEGRLYPTTLLGYHEITEDGAAITLGEWGLTFTFALPADTDEVRYVDAAVSFASSDVGRTAAPGFQVDQTIINSTLVEVTVSLRDEQATGKYLYLANLHDCKLCSDRAKLFMNDIYYPVETYTEGEGILLADFSQTWFKFNVTRTTDESSSQAAAFRIWHAFEKRFTVKFT